MKFCMLTTFFGPHSFGGDAAYVDRLATSLAGSGHEVHIIYCVDAFNIVRGNHPERPYQPAPGVFVHPLKSSFGPLSPLATQISGRPLFKQSKIQRILDEIGPDVIHFHNISLIGGPGILSVGNKKAIRLMTAHEHWLHCPNHLLWKYDQKACDTRTCLSCVISARRPPQYWRYTGLINKSVRHLDYLLFPSMDALNRHTPLNLDVPMRHLPLFLPENWVCTKTQNVTDSLNFTPKTKPYIAAAGRLVRMKGFQKLIPLMANLPEIELKIAGTGPFEAELRQMAKNLPNVQFLGLCDRTQLQSLFRDARAVVVPSLFPETFGYVVLEAFAMKTPVIVHRGGGAIVETGEHSGGGIGYDNIEQLEQAILALVYDPTVRNSLAERGHKIHTSRWSESAHLNQYFEIIESANQRKRQTHRTIREPHQSPVGKSFHHADSKQSVRHSLTS